MYKIFYDADQEGLWFKKLSKYLCDAKLIPIPNSKKEQVSYGIDNVLIYDRPDIILMDNSSVILVLEKTVEVPSGHNVGQRFGRLAAAAQMRIPVIYFGPYKEFKHGGKTKGPRYMNLRLFHALDKLSSVYNTAVTTINWPVDERCEVIKNANQDQCVREYLSVFFDYYAKNGIERLTEHIKEFRFQKDQKTEQIQFEKAEVKRRKQYEKPPKSVEVLPKVSYVKKYGPLPAELSEANQIILYRIGMKKMRSDPYAGMASLYHYLYKSENTVMVLHFPNISSGKWFQQRKNTKTYRMYKAFADAILFQDEIVVHDNL